MKMFRNPGWWRRTKGMSPGRLVAWEKRLKRWEKRIDERATKEWKKRREKVEKHAFDAEILHARRHFASITSTPEVTLYLKGLFRDMFAAQACAAYAWADTLAKSPEERLKRARAVAKFAYDLSDAMMEERRVRMLASR